MLTKEFVDKLKYYHSNNDYESIIKESKIKLNEQPDSFFLLDIIGSTYGLIENFYESIEYYKRALVIDPTSYEVCCAIGISYFKLENYSEAECYYLKSIEIDSSKSEAYIRLAVLYSHKND